MTMRRLLYLVVVGTVLGVVGAPIAKDCQAREDAGHDHELAAEMTRSGPASEPHREDSPPVFVFRDALDAAGRRQAEAAMKAVAARCSKFAVFREGPRFEVGVVHEDVVAVSVKLTDMARAQGNTLWYQVWFLDGKPSTMVALKPISAELCGFAASETPERID